MAAGSTHIGGAGRLSSRTQFNARILAVLGGLSPFCAEAATSSGSLQPSVTIAALCSVSTTALDFGSVANISGNKNATATITVTCVSGVNYAIGLGPGTYGGGTVTTRRMKKVVGTQTIDYGIFKNPAHSQLWGDTGVDRTSSTGTGAPQNFTARGQIPGGQGTMPPGGYTDTVLVTLTY